MPGRPFEPGHKHAKGGARPGSGPKPNWYKELAAELLHDRKLLPRVADIAEGKEIFKYITKSGAKIETAAGAEAQISAFNALADRAWGKPKQEVEMSGDMKINLIAAIKAARAQRGLPL